MKNLENMNPEIQFSCNQVQPTESIKEQDGKWFWADETWDWHGPHSSRESASRRQFIYAADLMGEINVVIAHDWEMRKDRESLDTIHPCNDAYPWNCDCAGACGCHYESE